MRKITLVLSALMLCVMMNAQQNIATLIHDGSIRIFYGANSFVEAHNAAVSGDAINLSSGTFNACNITKNIFIRGAGWYETEKTRFLNVIDIRVPQTDTISSLYIEGVYFQGINIPEVIHDLMVAKCRVNNLYVSSKSYGSFVCCVIGSHSISNLSNTQSGSLSFLNCIYKQDCSTSLYYCNFYNCIMTGRYTSSLSKIKNSTIHACIIFTDCPLDNTNLVTDCISKWSTRSNNTFNNTGLGSNRCVDSWTEIFVNEPTISSGIITDVYSSSYEFTDSAKTIYVDNDGTEIGIYGGFMPFSYYPSYPRITKMQVGKKATADGKLSVDIEVTSAE